MCVCVNKNNLTLSLPVSGIHMSETSVAMCSMLYKLSDMLQAVSMELADIAPVVAMKPAATVQFSRETRPIAEDTLQDSKAPENVPCPADTAPLTAPPPLAGKATHAPTASSTAEIEVTMSPKASEPVATRVMPGMTIAAPKGMGGSKLAEITPSTASKGSSQVNAAHNSPGTVPAAFQGVRVISDTPQTAPAAAGGAKAAGSTPKTAMPLPAAHPSSVAKGSKQHWLGKASSRLLGGWAVPGVKVKKERHAAGKTSDEVIDLT